jgi:uncharacterized protein (TIGR03437 family)
MRQAAWAALLSVLSVVAVRADNNTHSNWTINVSEGGMTPAPGIPDDLPEVAVVGSTVHILWLANDPGGSCGDCVIWYRRSRDNGRTWDPRVQIATADKNLDTAYNSNRFMAVDNQNVVHIAWPTTNPANTFDGWLMYRRSKDGGTTWDPVKNLYDVNTSPWWPTITVISTDGVKTTIAADIQSDRAGGGWIQLLTTADGGTTFTSASVFGTATTDSWYLIDAKRAGDRTYVLYSDTSDLYGHVAKEYLKVIPDSGSAFGPYLLSVPSKDGNHRATIWQSNNYSPKIALAADKAYVVFGCEDANNVERSLMRRLYNYGANLDPAIITSDDDPDGSVASPDDVSVAGNTAGGMMVYHVDLGDKYGGINKIVVKRYSEAAQAAQPATPLFTKASYFRGSNYPTIAAGSAQNAYVMWQAPTLARSTDSFNTIIDAVEPNPLGTWSGIWPTRLKTTIGSDGTLHWVEVGAFKGNKGDADILYGNWSMAPSPGQTNMALSLFTSDSAYRYDAMEVPAGVGTTNFTNAMTLAAWVQVQTGGSRPCCTDLMPIVSKQEYIGNYSYALNTVGLLPNRFPAAVITTTASANLVRIQPPSGQGILTEGQWYHLAFTYDSAAGPNNFKLYVNGIMVAQGTATGQIAAADGPLVIGSLGAWTIDDLSLWNRALSPDEIFLIKSGPLKGNESGLALYFNFDNTTAALNNPNGDGVLQYQESFIPSTYSTSAGAAPYITGVANIANYAADYIAPNSLASIYGANLTLSDIPVTVKVTDAAGVVWAASTFYQNYNRVDFLVPAGVAIGAATVATSSQLGATTAKTKISTVAPSLFSADQSGTGLAAGQFLTVSASGTQTLQSLVNANLSANPVDVSDPTASVYLILYGTGLRGYQQSVNCTVGGSAVPCLAVAQGAFMGLDQVNIGPLPTTLKGKGTANIVVTADGVAANTVTGNFK